MPSAIILCVSVAVGSEKFDVAVFVDDDLIIIFRKGNAFHSTVLRACCAGGKAFGYKAVRNRPQLSRKRSREVRHGLNIPSIPDFFNKNSSPISCSLIDKEKIPGYYGYINELKEKLYRKPSCKFCVQLVIISN